MTWPVYNTYRRTANFEIARYWRANQPRKKDAPALALLPVD